MPSRFPWSSKTETPPDPHLENPRTSSRQQIVYPPPRQTPPELSYEQYVQNQQAYQSTTSFESGSSPPASSPSGGAAPPPPLEYSYARDPYEQLEQQQQQQQQQPQQQQQQQQQQFAGPTPLALSTQQRTFLQKPQAPPKKSLRSKLLGASAAPKEDLDHSRDGIFGRRKSIRRKEAPTLDQPLYQQQDQRSGPLWSQAENSDIARSPRQQHPYGVYDQEHPGEDIDARAFFPHPTESADPYQQQYRGLEDAQQQPPNSYLNYSGPTSQEFQQQQQGQQQQQQPPNFQLYRETTPDSPVAPEPNQPQASRSSFDSYPQPPSRPNSRPISRQSHEKFPSVSQSSQHQIDQPQIQTQQTAESPQQANQQQKILAAAAPMAPFSGQRQQQRSLDSSKMNPHQHLTREISGLHPGSTVGSETNSQNTQKGQEAAQEELRSRTPPPPPRSASDMTETEINQLIRDHREMKQKYNNVKRQYFEKREQVDSLQNTLAHQRIIQSRTQWDDGEYITRMTRLDGLISQLAFGMRKDWKAIPEWLQPYTNKDALQVAKQEMTAVGRAFVSRWLAEELFDRYFHPGLEPSISIQLKDVQRNIRDYAPPPQSGEEEEALNARIVNWRLATVDGLQPLLTSHEAMSHRQALVQELNQRLVKDIEAYMSDPPPTGLEGGVHMIVELAIAIQGNLPLESRDVRVAYYPPGYPVNTEFMKLETGIPLLPGSLANQENAEGEQASVHTNAGGHVGGGGDSHDLDLTASHNGKGYEEHGKRSFLGSLVGGTGSSASHKRNPSPSRGFAGNKVGNNPSAAGSQTSLPLGGQPREDRVRMCVFLGTQIRGKLVLFKAPVYKM